MNQPLGKRFSLTYLDRGAPGKDSARLRARLAVGFEGLLPGWKEQSDFGRFFVRETGAPIQTAPDGATYYPTKIFESGELRDVLDFITLFFQFLKDSREVELKWARSKYIRDLTVPDPADWLRFVERAFKEENLGYCLDSSCGVHLYVDAEFDHTRASAIAALDRPAFTNARSSLEDTFRHLDATPADTKAAVRSIFEAVEVVAKQLCPESKNLNAWLARNTLKTRCLDGLPVDAIEQKVWAGVFESLAEWVDALHNYRHGQNADEPVAPSEQLAVLAVSTGCGYLRTLAEAFHRLNPGT